VPARLRGELELTTFSTRSAARRPVASAPCTVPDAPSVLVASPAKKTVSSAEFRQRDACRHRARRRKNQYAPSANSSAPQSATKDLRNRDLNPATEIAKHSPSDSNASSTRPAVSLYSRPSATGPDAGP
jgi:hypothetical protein